MIPTTFDYKAPTSLSELMTVLDDGALVLAGGTWVVPALNRGELQPRTVVDLRQAGLDTISEQDDVIRVGAMCTYENLLSSEVIKRRLPILHTMARGVTGGRQILCQGTLGGALGAARPSSDAPGVATALGGRFIVHGPGGQRSVASENFLLGAQRTSLALGEVLTAIEFQAMDGQATGYYKLKHSQSSWPIATATAVLRPGGENFTHGTVTLGGVSETPIHVDISEFVAGRAPTPDVVAAAAEFAGAQITAPWSDVLAPAEYRKAVAPVVAARALRLALGNEVARTDRTHWS
jgi:carbon-monoxide dehydrogenase medium subunit